VQEMVYLKAIQKINPMDRFCLGNHRSRNISEKIRRGFRHISFLDPPMYSTYQIRYESWWL